MIEVLIGMSVLAVGASGVIALQKITVLGVTEGRNLAAGSAVAARHIEAIRAEGAMWNSGTDIGEAPLVDALVTASPNWIKPPALLNVSLGASNVNGATSETLGAGDGDAAYCTHMRAVVVEAQAGQPVLLRIDVRTFWAKSGMNVTTECGPTVNPGDFFTVSPITVASTTHTVDDYGWVFLTTSLRRNTLP